MAKIDQVKAFAKQAPGKFTAFMLVGLLVVGLASAAIVTYLSNTVTATATVDSPVSIGISPTAGSYGVSPITFTTTGGSNVQYYTETTNLANNPITGGWEIVVGNTGISCSDVTSLKVTTTNTAGTFGPTDIVGSCAVVDANTVKYSYAAGSTLIVGYVDQSDWDLTFNPLALGTYTVDTKFVP